MRQSKSMRVWNILYPIGIYYVVTTVTLFILDFILPETVDSKLFRQLITSMVALPFLISFYRQDQMMRGNYAGKPSVESCKAWFRMQNLQFFAGAFLTGGCFAVAWNNLLGMVRIAEYSASYSQVTETFYTGRILLEIAALCIVIPVVEELLYRGIVCGRIWDWLGIRAAFIGSALIFGLVHMNLVQFVYAAVFGLLLACLAEVTGNLSGAVAAHMAANLTSVLRAETQVFKFMEQSQILSVFVMIVLFAAAGAGVWWLWQKKGSQERKSKL